MNWGRRSGRQGPDEASTPPAGSAPTRPLPAQPLPHQADPLDGVVEDTRPFFLPRRRRRQDDWVDPAAATVPAGSEPAPVAGSPMAERVRSWRRHLLPFPEEVVDEHLGSGEQVLHLDHPSLRWFVVSKLPLIAVLVADVVLVAYALRRGNAFVASVLWLVAVVLLIVLLCQRLADRYTSYVITNTRMMRMTGIVGRSVESIPWIRVTDVHFRQTQLQRLLDFATLHIESANESMGLRELAGVPDPLTFNRHLMDMVVAKQGPSVPLGRRSDYAILPPPRGLFGRRQRQALVHRRSAVDARAEEGAGATSGQPPQADQSSPARRRPAGPGTGQGGPLAPDPAVGDLSNLERTAEHEIAADRRRQAAYYEPDPSEGGERRDR